MRISDATNCPGNSTGVRLHLSNEMRLNTYVTFKKAI